MYEFRFDKREKGFTLPEVLVVIIIIGILVAIAVPIYNNTTAKTDQAVHDANARLLYSAAQLYMCKEWDETEKTADDMKKNLKAYLSEKEYPQNPTKSGEYVVTISDQGKINVSPAIGDYE